MTLTIHIEFLHGTYRADPEGLAHTGQLTSGEWPPSPMRVFAALIAADGTGERCRFTDGTELEFLERLEPPAIHADATPIRNPNTHQRLLTRHVAEQQEGLARSTHMGHVVRAGVPIRPGVRVSPKNPQVAYVYDTDTPRGVIVALQRRAARVGYLGTADSPVRVNVAPCLPDNLNAGEEFVPDPHGDIAISVPRPGHLAMWDTFHREWTERGPSVGRSQYPGLRHQVRYRTPTGPATRTDGGTVVAWLRLETPITGRRAAAVSALFKRAVLSQYQRIHGTPPSVMHGHTNQQRGYDLARYLPLPDVGGPRSNGKIHGLALWLPPGVDAVTQRRARDAAVSICKLVAADMDVAVHPWNGQRRPAAADPQRWTQASTRWVTAFPAIHDRHVRLNLDAVARWCEHAGLPEPVAYRSDRHPLIVGGVDMSPTEVHHGRRPARPYSHIELVFAEPVGGPVVIGSGRQRGLGLCAPAPQRPNGAPEGPADE